MKNNLIKILKGPDRVRKRPAVIFGAQGIEGAVNAIKMLLDIFITEASFGMSTGLDVMVHKDNSISIRSFDSGFILDETEIDGKPAWHYYFCEMYPGPREPDEDFYSYLGKKHNALFGRVGKQANDYKTRVDDSFNLCCVQYASEYMQVESTREGVKKSLYFKNGFAICEKEKEITQEKNNTFIHFLPDAKVFGEDIIIPDTALSNLLKETAIAIAGFECKLTDERTGAVETYCYPDGAKSYLLNAQNNPTEFFTNEIEATGKDRYNRPEYTAKVKITLCFCRDSGKVLCLHNHKKIENGGRHLDAIKEKLIYSINREFDSEFDNIMNNVALIVESFCPENATCYENATKKAIVNRMITDMTSDLLTQDFDYYLKLNHDVIYDILDN